MKSLYNISGILPAQCRANPHDCGISWNEHRKVERVKREDIIRVEAPDLSAHLKEIIDGCMIKLRSQYAELSRISEKSSVALKELGIHEETLKPIDLQTIQVGDTVRLVGDLFSSQKWSVNFTKYQYYEVIMVDRENRCGMPVMIRNDKGINNWMFGEDLVLVEQA